MDMIVNQAAQPDDYLKLAGAMDLEALAAEVPDTVPDLQLTNTQMESIGWDITLMPQRQHDIMRHYGLNGAQWLHLQRQPVYLAGVKHATAALKSDPNIAARIVARAAMTQAVTVASDLARSPLVEPKDRLNAVKLLADIVQMGDTGAGMENRKAGMKASAGGGGITINFGSVVGQALKSVIVERDAE
jgi:hypothetical protein